MRKHFLEYAQNLQDWAIHDVTEAMHPLSNDPTIPHTLRVKLLSVQTALTTEQETLECLFSDIVSIKKQMRNVIYDDYKSQMISEDQLLFILDCWAALLSFERIAKSRDVLNVVAEAVAAE